MWLAFAAAAVPCFVQHSVGLVIHAPASETASRADRTRSSSQRHELLTWVSPGCPGAHNDQLYLLADDRAGVRCCAGTTGDATGGIENECTTPSSCSESTWEEAQSTCTKLGLRLCTMDELRDGRCCGTDCGLESELVWTASRVRNESSNAPWQAVSMLAEEQSGVDWQGIPWSTNSAKGDIRLLPVAEPRQSAKQLYCGLKEEVGRASNGMRVVGMDSMSMPMTYKTCAVVSSSGVLKQHRHGDEISKADMIMRFNNAPTEGFENIVGHGTTLRVVNEKILMNWLGGVDLDLLDDWVTYVSTCAICNVGKSQLVNASELFRRRSAVHMKFPHIDMYGSTLEVEEALDEWFRRVYFSEANHHKKSPAGVTTGTLGMVIALSICDEVKAYGFAQSSTDGVPYNYYDDQSTARKTNLWHRSWTAEKALWRRLATNGQADVDATDVAVIPGFSQVTC